MWNVSTMRPEPSEHHHSTICHICSEPYRAVPVEWHWLRMWRSVRERWGLDASRPTGLFRGDDGFTENKLNWSDYCLFDCHRAIHESLRLQPNEQRGSLFAVCSTNCSVIFSLYCMSFKCPLLSHAFSLIFSQDEPCQRLSSRQIV